VAHEELASESKKFALARFIGTPLTVLPAHFAPVPPVAATLAKRETPLSSVNTQKPLKSSPQEQKYQSRQADWVGTMVVASRSLRPAMGRSGF
jgi:hypothetical protein